MEKSVTSLGELWEREGPFDGVLGFSQGACLVAVLAARQSQGLLPPGMSFEFAAVFSGFLPNDPTFAAEIKSAAPVMLPSFHCYGGSDEIISPAQSLEAVGLFDPASAKMVMEHDGGHLVSDAILMLY